MKMHTGGTLSKREIKHIRSLRQKKFRERYRCFVIEGPKLLQEAARSGARIQSVFTTRSLPDFPQARLISEKELEQLSGMPAPHTCVALIDYPETSEKEFPSGWSLAVHDLNDPGNLGTLIRLSDWYGVDTLICSTSSVDVYNPKVVQSTMGSIFRVKVQYVELTDYLTRYREATGHPVWAADMHGTDYRSTPWPEAGILVLGSESHGVPQEIHALVDRSISIPGAGRAESLNVALSAGILISEAFRDHPSK